MAPITTDAAHRTATPDLDDLIACTTLEASDDRA